MSMHRRRRVTPGTRAVINLVAMFVVVGFVASWDSLSLSDIALIVSLTLVSGLVVSAVIELFPVKGGGRQ
jgi:hypothetical protein